MYPPDHHPGAETRGASLHLVRPDGPRPAISASSDLNLLLEFGGRLLSEGEVRRLLEAAGFRVMRVVREPEARFVLIEAQPVSTPVEAPG